VLLHRRTEKENFERGPHEIFASEGAPFVSPQPMLFYDSLSLRANNPSPKDCISLGRDAWQGL
jgi:hypothetical protein